MGNKEWKCCGEKSDCYQCAKGPPAEYNQGQDNNKRRDEMAEEYGRKVEKARVERMPPAPFTNEIRVWDGKKSCFAAVSAYKTGYDQARADASICQHKYVAYKMVRLSIGGDRKRVPYCEVCNKEYP